MGTIKANMIIYISLKKIRLPKININNDKYLTMKFDFFLYINCDEKKKLNQHIYLSQALTVKEPHVVCKTEFDHLIY